MLQFKLWNARSLWGFIIHALMIAEEEVFFFFYVATSHGRSLILLGSFIVQTCYIEFGVLNSTPFFLFFFSLACLATINFLTMSFLHFFFISSNGVDHLIVFKTNHFSETNPFS